MFYCFTFRAYAKFFIEVLIETNVNISNGIIFLMFIDVWTILRNKQSLHSL